MSEAIHDERPELQAYPGDLTFHDLIARNKRNSMLLMVGMGGLVVLLAVAIAAAVMVYGSGVISLDGIVLAVVVAALVMAFAGSWSYYRGANAILSISGARKIEKQDDPQLFNVVEELSLAAGQPMPEVYLIDSDAMNAFATGRDPEHAAVAVTRGLRARLTRDELAGVMAHEISHVRHYDIRLTMLLATLVGMIVLAADVFLRMTFYSSYYGGGRSMRRSSDRGGGKGGGGAAMIIVVVLALLLAIVAPLLARLIQFAVSRQREYLADAGAVELTRYPQGLADALKKLSADRHELTTANKATAHLFIINPFQAAKGKTEWRSVFSTHPPTQERIARLEALMR